jgi:pimeloyl-ACP methyl ester carboxylesterase
MAASFEERPVAFEWRDDDHNTTTLMRGTLAVPPRRSRDADAANADAQRPTPAVVLAHGYLSTRDGIALFPRLAHRLAELSIASLRFDFRGAGETGGAARLGDYKSQARQLAAAARWLEQEGQGGDKFRVIGVLGHSKGATSALLFAEEWAGAAAAERDSAPPPPPLRLVHLSGRFDLRQGLDRFFGTGQIERLLKGEVDSLPVKSPEMVNKGRLSDYWVEYSLTAEGARERFSVDVAGAAARVGASGLVRTLVVHGDADRAVPCEDGRAVWKAVLEAEEAEEARAAEAEGAGTAAAGPARAMMVELEGADHNFTREEYATAALDAIVPFFVAAMAAEADGG